MNFDEAIIRAIKQLEGYFKAPTTILMNPRHYASILAYRKCRKMVKRLKRKKNVRGMPAYNPWIMVDGVIIRYLDYLAMNYNRQSGGEYIKPPESE